MSSVKESAFLLTNVELTTKATASRVHPNFFTVKITNGRLVIAVPAARSSFDTSRNHTVDLKILQSTFFLFVKRFYYVKKRVRAELTLHASTDYLPSAQLPNCGRYDILKGDSRKNHGDADPSFLLQLQDVTKFA